MSAALNSAPPSRMVGDTASLNWSVPGRAVDVTAGLTWTPPNMVGDVNWALPKRLVGDSCYEMGTSKQDGWCHRWFELGTSR